MAASALLGLRVVLRAAEQRVRASLELVNVDVAAGRLTVRAELDLLGHAGYVDRRDKLVDLRRVGVARLDRRDERGRRVVALAGVDRRGGGELRLVRVGERLARRAGRAGRVDQA